MYTLRRAHAVIIPVGDPQPDPTTTNATATSTPTLAVADQATSQTTPAAVVTTPSTPVQTPVVVPAPSQSTPKSSDRTPVGTPATPTRPRPVARVLTPLNLGSTPSPASDVSSVPFPSSSSPVLPGPSDPTYRFRKGATTKYVPEELPPKRERRQLRPCPPATRPPPPPTTPAAPPVNVAGPSTTSSPPPSPSDPAHRFHAAAKTKYIPEELPPKKARRQLQPCPPSSRPRPSNTPAAEASTSTSNFALEDQEKEGDGSTTCASNSKTRTPAPEALTLSNHYACGYHPCFACNVNRAPIGHKKSLPTYIASILRHRKPERFESPDVVRAKVVSPPPTSPEVPEGDDLVYAERGAHEPPKWGMQPKKSCFVKKHRYHPYPRPTVPRTEVEVNASLKEAFERRHKQNFEGPKAIAIHDAVTAIYVPGTETWKWEPENRGPLGAFDFPEEDVDDEGDAEEREEVVEMLLPTNGKKRQFEEESDEDVQTTAGEPVHEPPAKKPRRSQRLIERKNPGFTSDNNPTFEFTFTAPLPSSTSLSPPSSPTQSSSPSSTVTGVLPTESPSDDDVLMSNDEAQGSSRKARVTRRKARVQFAAPTGMHPVHGIKDSIHFHYRRLKPQSQATLKSKKKRIVKRKGPIWTPDQIKSAKAKKAEWEEMRRNKFEHETSLAEIRTRVADEEEGDPASEAWKDAVERYEAAYPQIDFGGVRAKHLRPAKMEVPARNRELTRMPKPTEPMRWWYPSWEHPAWDGIPREVLMDWTRSDHFKVRVAEVKNALSAEDEARAKRRRAMEMEMGERSDAETVVDETEDAMRRAFVAEGNEGEQVLPSPAPQTSTETSPLFVIPALKMTPDVEALWEARWSAPGALHSTAA